MISGRRKELNCATSSKTMTSPATGSFSLIESWARIDVSASPPSAQL